MTSTPESFNIDLIVSEITIGYSIFAFIQLPILFTFISDQFEDTPYKILKLSASFIEATILPVSFIFMSIRAIQTSNWSFGIGIDLTYIIGMIISDFLFVGLLFSVSYITLKQLGYCRQIKPDPPRHALGGFAITILSILLFEFFFGLPFDGLGDVDIVHFIFTPITIGIAIGIRKLSKKPLSVIISDLAIINTVFYVVLSLTYWLLGSSSNIDVLLAVNLGLVGFIIGCMMYLFAWFWSHTEKDLDESDRIDVRTKNWHFLEVFTVFFFFLFAPESISSMANLKSEEAQSNAMLSELRSLSGGTIIGIDNITAKQKDFFNGTVCLDVINRGQNFATNLTVNIVDANKDRYYCDDQPIKFQIRLAAPDTLGVGKSETLCGDYKISTEKNDYKRYRQECDSFEEFFKDVTYVNYNVKYLQDPQSRFDYSKLLRLRVNR